MKREWGSQWNIQMMNYLMESGPNSVFKSNLPEISQRSCLVLGAGPETNLIKESGNDVVGVSISVEELHEIRRSDAHLIRCDAQSLPLKGSIFNMIICRSTLHHLNNTQVALKEMNRVLKKNSIIFLHEPGILNFVAFIGRKFFPTKMHESSEKPFSRTALKENLTKHFEIAEEIDFFVFVHLLPILGRRLKIFGNKNILRAMFNLDNLLSKTFLKNLCWVFIFYLRKN